MESSPPQHIMNRETKTLLSTIAELLKPCTVVPDIRVSTQQEKQAQHSQTTAIAAVTCATLRDHLLYTYCLLHNLYM